jgi:iron complex outermembrane receptor protein
VTGIRESLKSSLKVKRAANAVVDVITAEGIGKFPDRNVAESLSHIPGISVDHAFGCAANILEAAADRLRAG